jgi:hypothetical protein
MVPDIDLLKKQNFEENDVIRKNVQITKFCSLATPVVIFEILIGHFVFSDID